jgi:hypothetical protein
LFQLLIFQVMSRGLITAQYVDGKHHPVLRWQVEERYARLDGDLRNGFNPIPMGMGDNNTVHPCNILSNHDVRTTVMVRNIPNKFQAFELKRMLDAVCDGEYDFFYLRVDFVNHCNVGYAFVNFTHPYAIIRFHSAYSDMKWSVYGSEKTCITSYATIQGREALVERFRNSGVRVQWASFRPKIFHAKNVGYGGLGGQGRLVGGNANTYQAGPFDAVEELGLQVQVARLPATVEPDKFNVGDELPFPPPNNEAKVSFPKLFLAF